MNREGLNLGLASSKNLAPQVHSVWQKDLWFLLLPTLKIGRNGKKQNHHLNFTFSFSATDMSSEHKVSLFLDQHSAWWMRNQEMSLNHQLQCTSIGTFQQHVSMDGVKNMKPSTKGAFLANQTSASSFATLAMMVCPSWKELPCDHLVTKTLYMFLHVYRP